MSDPVNFSLTSDNTSATLTATKHLNDDLKVFAQGTATMPGSYAVGAGAQYASPAGHGASLSAAHTIGGATALGTSGTVNLLSTPNHNLSATAFHQKTILPKGPTIDTTGGSLNYQNSAGLGLSAGMNTTPIMKSTTYNAQANANLWTSKDGLGSLNANAGISRTHGPFGSSTNKSGGFSFNRRF